MSERRRSLRSFDSRHVNVIGIHEDSTDDEEFEDSRSGGSDEDVEDNVEDLSAEEDSDDDTGDDEIDAYISPDGTAWSRNRQQEHEEWRSGTRRYNDGPANEANSPGNIGLTKSSILQMMISPNAQDTICKWTNEFGASRAERWNHSHPNADHPKVWKALTPRELRAFIGLLLLSGVEKPRKKPWKELWSIDRKIRCAPFPATMSRNRFYEIMSNLRFDNALERHQQESSRQSGSTARIFNKLRPIEDLFHHIVGNFDRIYVPAKQLCVDEQLLKFRGNCPFRVYMPMKPGKYGIRIWAIVDVYSGYTLNLKIYEGRSDDGRQVGLGMQVVLHMAESYRGSERCITADNFFTSMSLVRELLDMRLAYCGTLRKSRREVPLIAKNLNMTQEQELFLYNNESQITLLRHRAARRKFVLLLSSAHYDSNIITVASHSGSKEIPAMVEFYNCNKVGVDVADQMVGNYTGQYPSKRWPVKVFIHLIDSAALNAFIIWIRNDPSWHASTRSKRRLFLRDLAYELILPEIRHRAATVPNLHKEIGQAMEIMGVEYHSQERPFAVPVASSTHGRCPFCGPTTSQQRTTTRKCAECRRFVCTHCSEVFCPECTPGRRVENEQE